MGGLISDDRYSYLSFLKTGNDCMETQRAAGLRKRVALEVERMVLNLMQVVGENGRITSWV